MEALLKTEKNYSKNTDEPFPFLNKTKIIENIHMAFIFRYFLFSFLVV
jgi:hypothetical protein